MDHYSGVWSGTKKIDALIISIAIFSVLRDREIVCWQLFYDSQCVQYVNVSVMLI